MKRLFAAIRVHPTEEFLKQYFFLKNNLKQERIRWVHTENFHITLKFFGETPEHHIPAIGLALKKAAANTKAIDLTIENTGIFGSRYDPKVIWFGIEPYDELTALANTVFDELEKIGIERGRQNFVPHLTIARITQIEDKDRFQKVIDKRREGFIQKEEVNNFHLFESQLSPKGAVYTIIDNYSFLL